MTGKSSSSKQASSRAPDAVTDVLSKTPLLLSSISLPADYFVAFVKLEAANASQGHQDVELARRELVRQNISRTLLEGTFPFVQLTKDQAILWVFRIENNEEKSGKLSDISFENLQVIQSDRFQYPEIYPCSSSCSVKRAPCPDCLNPPLPPQPPTPLPLYRERSPADVNPSSRSTTPFPLLSEAQFTPPKPAACLLPRRPLRHPLKSFLAAVKDRYIDDFCQEAAKRKFEGRSARAFRGGFLLGPSTCNSDWGDEWDSSRRFRPLVHCMISLALHRRDILISYKFALTYLSPLLSCIPLPPGSPLHLLPFSTPAYFVNTYTGPCGVLIKQFEPYLTGLGAGQWTSGHQGVNPTNTPEFVIVWVKIQTLPDEDLDEKGFFVIWPSRLCVRVLPVPSRNGEKEFAYRREMQRPLPELPPALQPSPVPSAATVHAKPLHPPPSPDTFDRPLQSPTSRSPNSRGSPKRSHRPSFSRPRSSLTSNYLHSFRKHNLRRSRSLREIRDVALNVGKFVDAVAKEREKERERIRRERDAAQQAAKQVGDSSTIQDVSETQQQSPMDIVVESPAAVVNANPTMQEGPTSHPAYPSPPDEPPTQTRIAPKVEEDLQQLPKFEFQEPTLSSTPAVNYTPFESLDDSWMSNADFLRDLGMDLDMDVGMGSSNAAQDIMSGDPMKIDLDSFVLTDDDFSFFDDHPASNFPASAISDANNILSAFHAIPAHIPSPNVPTALSAQAEAPSMPVDISWMRGQGVFASPTVSVFSHHNTTDTPAPDLVPASPSKSLATQSGPATPNVAFSTETYLNVQPHSSTYGLDQFDPVQFAPRHSLVDAKYTKGKFQLSSPSTSSSSGRSDYMSVAEQPGFRTCYTLKTDPSVAMVRRLIGMKAREGQVSVLPASVLSVSGSGDWTDLSALDDIHEDARSDSDSDSDSEGSAFDVDEPVLDHSRPSTPLPSYVPPGASLLATRFTYDRLVPLSTKLPIPAPSFDEDDMDMGAQLVPTPVSPSAVASSPKDEMKRYLSLLRLLCDELLDNPVWASAWRASLVEQSQSNNKWFTENGAWFDDVRFAITCFHAVSSTSTPTNIEQFILIASPDEVLEGRDVLFPVEPTNVIVGKSDSLIQISPPALRFWDKLGLSPRSGRKDVTAFVVHNDQHDITDDAASWLADLSRSYTTRGYGDHTPGIFPACKEDGILVIHFDNFRTNMLNILQSSELPSGILLFYVITSVSMLSTLSPALRQLLNGIKHIVSNNPDGRLYFHLIPDHACKPSDCHFSKDMQEEIARSVYDRIRRPTYKMISRQLHSDKENLSKNFKAPAFTLARPNRGSVSLEFQRPDRISSVSDRHMLLHIAFCISENKRWLIAMCLDERHEMQEVGIWKLDNEKANISNLWDFAMKFAGQANIEWRVVFAKLGPLPERELDAWNDRAINYLTKEAENVELHAYLVSFEDESWLVDDVEAEQVLSVHKRPPESPTRGSILSSQDASFLLSNVRCSTFSSPSLRRAEWGHVPKDETEDPSYHYENPLRPLHSSILIDSCGGIKRPYHLQARYLHLLSSVSSARSTLRKTDQENLLDISRSYCDLATFQSMKGREGSSSPLPPHLATVALVRSILDLSA